MKLLKINPQTLYEGCLLAALAHAVTVGEYPEIDYEHSWDGMNYCVNNSEGCRGTITFHDKYIVAVFRKESKVDFSQNALSYFKGAPKEIIDLAMEETLQYVLDEADGETLPLITAAMWGSWDNLYSNQPINMFLENGAHIIDNQLLDKLNALKNWNTYYEFHDGQEDLIVSLFNRKRKNGLYSSIILDKNEISMLYGQVEKNLESLGELNILNKRL